MGPLLHLMRLGNYGRESSPDLGLKLGLFDYCTSHIYKKKRSSLFCQTDAASVSTAKLWRILNLNIIRVHHGGRFADQPHSYR